MALAWIDSQENGVVERLGLVIKYSCRRVSMLKLTRGKQPEAMRGFRCRLSIAAVNVNVHGQKSFRAAQNDAMRPLRTSGITVNQVTIRGKTVVQAKLVHPHFPGSKTLFHGIAGIAVFIGIIG